MTESNFDLSFDSTCSTGSTMDPDYFPSQDVVSPLVSSNSSAMSVVNGDNVPKEPLREQKAEEEEEEKKDEFDDDNIFGFGNDDTHPSRKHSKDLKGGNMMKEPSSEKKAVEQEKKDVVNPDGDENDKEQGNYFQVEVRSDLNGADDTLVGDTFLQDIKQKKLKNRIKMENLKSSTSEYLDKNQPANTKVAVKTAIAALESVIKQIKPEEERKLEEMPEDDLADYLEQFFKCVVKQDGTTYNASTLTTYYNSLNRFFVEKRQLNIKTSGKFSRVGKVLVRRQEESMKEGEIPGKHASKAIPKEVLVEAISQGNFGNLEPRGLTANVMKAFQAGFGIRNRTEMYNICIRDIEVGPLKMNGVPEYIEMGERITKMRRGKGGQGKREYKPRIESDDDKPENCLMRPFLLMQSKKTPAMLAPDMPLFLSCLNSPSFENKAVWFANQRMGLTTVGTLVANQIKSAGFDTKKLKITGTSIRKNMFDSMIQNDVPGVYASAHGGHSSLKSKENYVSSESASTKAINKILATNLSGEESSSFNDLVNVERSKVKDTIHNIKIRGKENQDPNISEESAPLRTGEALPGHPQALLPAGGPVHHPEQVKQAQLHHGQNQQDQLRPDMRLAHPSYDDGFPTTLGLGQALLPAGGPAHHPEQVKQAQLHHGQNQQDQLRPDMRLAHPSYDDGFPTTLGLGQALTYPQTQYPGLPMATAGQVHVPMSSGGHIQSYTGYSTSYGAHVGQVQPQLHHVLHPTPYAGQVQPQLQSLYHPSLDQVQSAVYPSQLGQFLTGYPGQVQPSSFSPQLLGQMRSAAVPGYSGATIHPMHLHRFPQAGQHGPWQGSGNLTLLPTQPQANVYQPHLVPGTQNQFYQTSPSSFQMSSNLSPQAILNTPSPLVTLQPSTLQYGAPYHQAQVPPILRTRVQQIERDGQGNYMVSQKDAEVAYDNMMGHN